VERAAREQGFEPHISFETYNAVRAQAIVSAGLGVAILPESDTRRPGPSVAVVELDGPVLQHFISVVHGAPA
jgi:DNA-binding transcriptional LysR family regulator